MSNTVLGSSNITTQNITADTLNGFSITDTDNPELSVGGGGAASLVGGINKPWTSSGVYYVDGLVATNDSGTVNAYGRVTVALVVGIAIITFSMEVNDSTSTSSKDFTFGIRPSTLSTFNSNIPNITPMEGGTVLYTKKGSTTVLDGMNGYGGTFLLIDGHWMFARVYQAGNPALVGGWPTSEFVAGIRMNGVCFGRY